MGRSRVLAHKRKRRRRRKMASSRIVAAAFAILCWCTLQGGQCTMLTVSPAKGVESLTPSVTLTCLTDTDTPAEIVLMQITRGEHEPLVLVRGGGGISFADGVTRKLEAAGDIDNTVVKGGYLNLTLHFPSHKDTGIYKCHVMYFDDTGVAKYSSSEVHLDIDQADASKAGKRVQSLETLVHELESKLQTMNGSSHTSMEPSHHFSAFISQEAYFIKDQMTVTFDQVISQEGQSYDPTTGIFTAPADGIYLFTLALAIEGSAMSVGFSLQTDQGQVLSRLYVEGKDVGDQSSVSSVANLKAGSDVRVVVVYMTANGGRLYNNQYSMFSGFMIKSL